MATAVYVPAGRSETVAVAVPPVTVTGPRVRSTWPVMVNVTVPAGAPAATPTGATVAVSVTVCPTVLGFGAVVRVVRVNRGAWLRNTWTADGPSSLPSTTKSVFPSPLKSPVARSARSPALVAYGLSWSGVKVRPGSRGHEGVVCRVDRDQVRDPVAVEVGRDEPER